MLRFVGSLALCLFCCEIFEFPGKKGKLTQAWWLIGASIPILWGQLDAVAVQLRLGHVDLAIAWSINGLMWWLSGFPVSFLFFCFLSLDNAMKGTSPFHFCSTQFLC